MEKLEKKQRDAIIKISTVRLTAKLALAGLSEVLAGKDVPVASKSTSSLEVDLERPLLRKLNLQRR